MKRIIFLGLVLGIAACASKPAMYYWGNYSKTLYEYKAEPTESNLVRHYRSIQDVIDKSKEFGLRVPPGVYAEYGTLMLTAGQKSKAIQFYQLEKATYPEATFLMDRMIKEVEVAHESD